MRVGCRHTVSTLKTQSVCRLTDGLVVRIRADLVDYTYHPLGGGEKTRQRHRTVTVKVFTRPQLVI